MSQYDGYPLMNIQKNHGTASFFMGKLTPNGNCPFGNVTNYQRVPVFLVQGVETGQKVFKPPFPGDVRSPGFPQTPGLPASERCCEAGDFGVKQGTEIFRQAEASKLSATFLSSIIVTGHCPSLSILPTVQRCSISSKTHCQGGVK